MVGSDQVKGTEMYENVVQEGRACVQTHRVTILQGTSHRGQTYMASSRMRRFPAPMYLGLARQAVVGISRRVLTSRRTIPRGHILLPKRRAPLPAESQGTSAAIYYVKSLLTFGSSSTIP
jgi:hypothetical protein